MIQRRWQRLVQSSLEWAHRGERSLEDVRGNASRQLLRLPRWCAPTKRCTKTWPPTSTLKQHIPWQIKIAAKIFLKRLPVGYGLWSRLRLFKHGAMESPGYAFDVFCTHFGM